MADWTGLAGFAGLAAALENIQDRRLKEAQVQQKLTEGTGEWAPTSGGLGGLGFLDAILGYNKPGQLGIGNQRYQFQPYAPVTEEQAKAWGMTYPEAFVKPAYEKPLPPQVQGPLELVPEEMGTREVPMPGIVGMRLGPKEKMALFQDQLKARREAMKFEREQEMFKSLGAGGTGTGGFGVGTSMPGGTVIPPEMLPEGVTPPAAGTPPSAAPAAGGQATQVQPTPASGKAAGVAPVDEARWKSLLQLVDETADREGVPRALVRAVIKQESNWDINAEGDGGKARGWFQLHEGAAKDAGIDPARRHEPELNVRGGIRYLALKLKQAGGDVDKALKLYNGGGDPNYVQNVRRWMTEQQPAVARTAPDTSMMVAGGAGAPAPQPAAGTGAQPSPPATGGATTQGATQPPATTTAPAPATTPAAAPATQEPPPQAPFRLSQAGYQQILANNQKITQNEKEIQALDAKQRQANYWAAQTKNAQLAGMATQIGNRIADLNRANDNLREQSQKLQQDEMKEWRGKGEAQAKEWREKQETLRKERAAPQQAADIKVATQAVEAPEELRGIVREFVGSKRLPEKRWDQYTPDEKALVQQEKTVRDREDQLISALDDRSKSALAQIIAEEKTPRGQVTETQIQRAREQGAARVKQETFDKEEAQRLAKLNAPMEKFAENYFHPDLLDHPPSSMSIPEAEKQGYKWMDKGQRDTLKNAKNSMAHVDRVNTLLFGGVDTDGSITGTAGEKFVGIYPTLEKGRTETQSVAARLKMTYQLRKGILKGTDVGQWSEALNNYIKGTLGAISRDLGGERGHFTDKDAERISGLFADLKTGLFALGPMTSSGTAKKLMSQVTSTISDRVRTARSMKTDEQLPWDVQGKLRPAPSPQAAAPTTPPGTAQERVPVPPPGQTTQERVPAQGAGTPPADGKAGAQAPSAAQPAQRQQQLTTQYPPGQYPGRTIRDPVTGVRYRSDGNAWQEVR